VSAKVPYVLLGNGRVALEYLRRMLASDAPPVLVVLNAPERQRLGKQLASLAESNGVAVAEWSPEGRAAVHEEVTRRPVWLLSVYFGHVLDEALLAAAAGRAVNLHPSFLPWCRGANTNIWPILKQCPAGVSLHLMVSKVDAGDILIQREVPVSPADTGQTLYEKLEDAAIELLCDSWPEEVLLALPGKRQPEGGSFHRASDAAALEEYQLDGRPEATAFFNLLRARTFPPHSGLLVRVNGAEVEARLELRLVKP
jgi:methionyl-tRNA formyltransferase